jgi:SAM-dependent methyltransferase
MHESVLSFGQRVLGTADILGKRVVEVGSMNINGSLRAHVESLNPSRYVGVDFLAGDGVDVVCDAGDLVAHFGPSSFDVVISTEMLEHAEDWRAAIVGMKRVLAPNGLLLLTARGPGFHLHGYPHDWHRFTVADMHRIFSDFAIDQLLPDPQCPGVMILARKPPGWDATALDLGAITVAPADAVNSPR